MIISSDGLFDNLYEDEIAMIVQEHVTSGESAATATVSYTHLTLPTIYSV